MSGPLRTAVLVLLTVLAWVVISAASFGVAPFTLTDTPSAPNGAWSWFEDERAIIDDSDPENPMLLVSSVSAGAGAEKGDIDLLWRNLNTGAQGVFELHDKLEQDDHNSAALYVRPDGRYLAMYTAHASDNLTRWRVSTNPHDPTNWEPEQTLDNGASTTYNNIYYLPSDNGGLGRTYNFTRADNYNPVIQVSNDSGTSWSKAGKLLTVGFGGDRPYVRYASDGENIHFISTERHPRDFGNSVYHGYVSNGVLYNSDGVVTDSNVFDSNGAPPLSLTTVFKNGSDYGGVDMSHAWTVSLEIDNTGNPVGVFSARANDSSQDHRFFYGRYDGAEWRVNEMAHAGAYLYVDEDDYTGLTAIDPNNPNVIYLSSDIDPRSGLGSAKYELYKGFTPDFGQSWTWTAITENSTVDNIRPIVPEWNGDNTAVTWLQGNYSTYRNWDTEVVGISLPASGSKSLLWRGNVNATSMWDVNSAANWDSDGGMNSVYADGDEVAFGNSATSHTVDLPVGVAPLGVAFSNKTNSYTLTGAGISGTGMLRVIGGGTVTLSNANNTYSGVTLVAKGKLALSGSTMLSGTPRIEVRSKGTLDVTASMGGVYTLSGQTLAIDGRVIGDIVATNNSTVAVNSSIALVGDLNLIHSKVTGAGTIQGDLIAATGSIIQVGGDGLTTLPTYTFVNANHLSNTTLADGSALNPVHPSVATANAWTIRGLGGGQGRLGNGGTFYQADPVVGGNSAPPLRTTISGLAPNTAYDVQVNFWDAADTEWRIRAGGSLDTLKVYDSPADAVSSATDGVYSGALVYNGTTPLTIEGNRTMYGAPIGSIMTDNSGNLIVYVDDFFSGNDDRTWFDGLSYASGVTFAGQSTMTVLGDLTLDSTSKVRIDIGDELIYDRINVTGSANLAGILEVRLTGAASNLQLNDVINIFDSATTTGVFDNYMLPALAPGLTWDVSSLHLDGSLKIVQSLPGDYNGDGVVNAADYTVWRDKLNQAPSGLWGGNRNLTSADSTSDYNFWRDNYGNIRPSLFAAAAASVPEPTGAPLLVIVALAQLSFRARMRLR